MIVIPAIKTGTDGMANAPSSEIPENAVLVVFDGADNTFTVYQPGDELPPEPDYDK